LRRTILQSAERFLTEGLTFITLKVYAISGSQEDKLFVTVSDAPTRKIVWAHLYCYFIAGKDFDVVHPHLSGDSRLDFVVVFQPYAEHRI
jgi:hypothetical protein